MNMASKPPNVVLIVLDSVRRDHVSCYGYGRETTPNIDRIGREGAVFERAFATSCWTLPSHGSLFTGFYPSRHGADLDTPEFSPEVTTLATRLGRLGYRTASVSCNGFITRHTGLTQGFDQAFDVEGLRGGDSGVGRVVRGIHRRWRRLTARDRGARRATRWSRRWLREGNPETPFFLFVNYMDCHLPYALGTGELHRFVEPERREEADRVTQDPFAVMAGEISTDPDELALLEALYDGALRYLDERIGELREELERLDVLGDTILIVTSDHGESFGEHGLLDHQFGLYEHLLAVPLVVRYPPWLSAGTRESVLVQHVDLFPTLLDLAGETESSPESTTDGVSLRDSRTRTAVFGEYLKPNLRAFRRRFPDADVSSFDVSLRSARDDRFKLLERDHQGDLLFDLEADPGETVDISVERPEILEELRTLLLENLGPRTESGGNAETGRTTREQEMRQRLELLGYL